MVLGRIYNLLFHNPSGHSLLLADIYCNDPIWDSLKNINQVNKTFHWDVRDNIDQMGVRTSVGTPVGITSPLNKISVGYLQVNHQPTGLNL